MVTYAKYDKPFNYKFQAHNIYKLTVSFTANIFDNKTKHAK